MTIQEMKELALHAAKKTAPAEFSVANVNDALSDAIKSMTGSVNDFMRNRYDIYDIIVETADKVVPDKVMAQLGAFCEVLSVPQGTRPLFKRGPIGRARAKKFLTQVALSGVYETFRLDSETFTIGMKSIGGGITMDFERFLDGAEDLATLMDVLAEAQVDGIYAEVQNALMAAVSSTKMPTKNKVSGSYSAASLQSLVNTVKAYGGGATIFASPEFIAAMGPDAVVPGFVYPAASTTPQSGMQGIYPMSDIEDIRATGRIHIFRGTPVVELRQSFLDEKNEKVMINPQFAYVLPTGNDKIVKVVMEGATQIYDNTNRDQSIEVMTYKKVGVGILAYNNWGVYQNTGISDADWYHDDLDLDIPMGPGNARI